LTIGRTTYVLYIKNFIRAALKEEKKRKEKKKKNFKKKEWHPT
jgi:hypothetical protein